MHKGNLREVPVPILESLDIHSSVKRDFPFSSATIFEWAPEKHNCE